VNLLAFLLILGGPGLLLGLTAGLCRGRLGAAAVVVGVVAFGGWFLYEHLVGVPRCQAAGLGECVLGAAVPVINGIVFVVAALTAWVVKLLLSPEARNAGSPLDLG
jgi:hypothetical protein